MWARIENYTVAEITETDPTGRFHPSLHWEAADDSVEVGDLFDGQTYSKPPGLSVSDLAAAATARVNAGYQAQMGKILDEYPEAETLSFDKQEREARAWSEWQAIGGTEPATPYIDAMLIERPIGKAELVSRIIIKADAFMAAHGTATGKRQRLEDDIKAAVATEDRASLAAIDW